MDFPGITDANESVAGGGGNFPVLAGFAVAGLVAYLIYRKQREAMAALAATGTPADTSSGGGGGGGGGRIQPPLNITGKARGKTAHHARKKNRQHTKGK